MQFKAQSTTILAPPLTVSGPMCESVRIWRMQLSDDNT